MRLRCYRRSEVTAATPRVSGWCGFRVVAVFATILAITACGGGGGGGSGAPVTFSLQAEARSPSQINLSWTPHPGLTTVVFARYEVHRNGVFLFSTSPLNTSGSNSELDPNTQYCYIVYASSLILGVLGRSNEICAVTPDTAPWRLETVDNAAISVGSKSLVNDSANGLHVSYRRGDGIVYATNTSGQWVSTLIDNATGGFDNPAIAMGTTGAIHISYNDPASGALKHATNASGSWVISSIDTTSFGSAIALDSVNRIHVSYVRNNQFGSFLSYANNLAGSWNVEFVTPASGVSSTALAIDAGGAAHVAYVEGSALCYVRYATNASGTWVDNTVIASNTGCAAAIALDASGKAHIVFRQSFDLIYATNASGTWATISVDQLEWVGNPDVSITRDLLGALHVSYVDHNADLKYATNSSGSWEKFYIDTRGNVGAGNAVRVNNNGSVHITYYDATNAKLKHATDR